MVFERNRRESPGTRALRTACRTLNSTRPELIRSMNLTIPLVDLPVAATSAVALAERIAAEHELVARAQAGPASLRVRLTRPGRGTRPGPAEPLPRELTRGARAAASTPAEAPAPAAPIDSAAPPAAPASLRPPLDGGVLIVEDDAALGQVIAEKLSRSGWRVRETRTAEEAVGAVLQGCPDLLLLDVHLPDRSGWDVLRELRQRGIAVRTVIIAGGWVHPGRLEEFRPAAFLPKPFPLDTLLRLVEGGRSASGVDERFDRP